MWRGLIDAYRDRLPVTDATPVVTLLRGQHAAAARAGAVVPDRRRGLPQGRGRQPDRLVQGPRHDGRGVQGRRGRQQGDHLRVDGQHVAPPPPRTPPAPGSPAPCSCHRARSRSASWRRRSCTVPGCCRSSGNFDDCLGAGVQAVAGLPGRTGQLGQHRPPARPEDGGLRDRVDALGDAPDIHCLPVGNAGNIAAYWMGYGEDARRRATPRARRRCTGSRRPAPHRS